MDWIKTTDRLPEQKKKGRHYKVLVFFPDQDDASLKHRIVSTQYTRLIKNGSHWCEIENGSHWCEIDEPGDNNTVHFFKVRAGICLEKCKVFENDDTSILHGIMIGSGNCKNVCRYCKKYDAKENWIICEKIKEAL